MKNIYIISMIVLAGVFVAMSFCRPDLLANNEFIRGFVTHDALSIMAVIMTIAIASIATIHIWFNELEAKHQATVFGKARREINHDAFILIWLFMGELLLLVIRFYFDSTTAISLFNGAALIIFLSSVITLIDVMNVVRALTPAE